LDPTGKPTGPPLFQLSKTQKSRAASVAASAATAAAAAAAAAATSLSSGARCHPCFPLGPAPVRFLRRGVERGFSARALDAEVFFPSQDDVPTSASSSLPATSLSPLPAAAAAVSKENTSLTGLHIRDRLAGTYVDAPADVGPVQPPLLSELTPLPPGFGLFFGGSLLASGGWAACLDGDGWHRSAGDGGDRARALAHFGLELPRDPRIMAAW
jgi:hypothetical protein